MNKLMIAVAFVGMTGRAFAQDSSYDWLPSVDILPDNVIQISETVPGMGEHWAEPSTLPLGPIYCVHEGKIVCIEFMMAQEDFQNGMSWPVLTGFDGLPPVNHTNISFEPEGHEGFTVPHYDVHLYFLSPEEMAQVQPNS